MSIEVRINKNHLDEDSLDHEDRLTEVVGVYHEDPILDIRDEHTIWLWVADNVCVELTDDTFERIYETYVEQWSQNEGDIS